MFDLEFRLKIIRLLFKDRSFKKRILPLLEPDFFESSYEKMIIRNLKSLGDNKFFDYTTFFANLSMTEKGKKDVKELELYKDVIDIDKKITDADETYSTVREFIIKENLKNTIITEYNKIQNEKEYDLGELLENVKKSLHVLPEKNFEVYDYFKELDNRLNKYSQGKSGIINKLFPIIPIMEHSYDWCIQEKEFVVIGAAPTKGKSALLINLLNSALAHNKKCLYITFEISSEIIARRLDATITNISTKDFEDKLTELKKKIRFRSDNFGNNLKIIELVSKAYTIDKLESLVNEFCDIEDFDPEIIFIDYLDLCKYNKGDARLPRWEQLANIYASAVSWQKKEKRTIITASQTGKESLKHIVVSMEQLADSPTQKMAAVDKVILFGQTQRMYDEKIFTFHIDKDRNGWSRGMIALFSHDWDKQKINFIKILSNADLMEMEKQEARYKRDLKSSKGKN